MIIKNKTLLITGGTGSFGNAVLNLFLHTDHFSEIRIFSRDEKKQDDMRTLLKNEKLKFYIGDVRDYNSVEKAMRGVASKAPAVQDLQQAARVGHESRCLPYRIARLAQLPKLALVAANVLDPGLLQHRPNARFSPRCRPTRVLV